MSHKKAIILTCGIALLWSLAGWNIKMITWSPYAIAAGRSIISVVLLLPMVVKGKSLHISRNVIGGAVCYTIFNYCFIISTKLATSAIAIMMQYTAPVYVAVLAWIFLKERITKADLISIVFISVSYTHLEEQIALQENLSVGDGDNVGRNIRCV